MGGQPKVEQPVFQSVANYTDGLQIRRYGFPGSRYIWAETTVSGDFAQAQQEGFQNIFQYIDGQNAKNMKINMTAPVTVEKVESTGNYIVRFYMPSAYTFDELPTPNNPDVKLVTLPEQVVSVTEFPGFANEKLVESNTNKLSEMINQNGLQATHAFPTRFCGFDSPFVVFDRRNDIWMAVK